MPSISTAAGRMEYQEAGSGLPLLLLHGTPGGSDQGLAAARVLAVRARVIAPSRPGYLGTPLTTGLTPSEQADAMIALLDELGVRSAVVLGVSGGGMAAAALAARHPERVRGLVLWSAVTTPARIPVWPLTHGPLARRSTGEALLRALRRSPRLLIGRAARDETAAESALAIAETVFPIQPRRDGLVNDARQASRLDAGMLADITVPVLVVHGTKDRNVPYRHAENAMRALPHARLVTVTGADHWTTPADRQAREALRTYLDEMPSAPA
ncbi:alpha/beta fold hydrolase [Microbacterium sp. RU33B]|uniref:alpha/beta fold hydrolase n=1 Tax=Microbacterium sp. RU33B TaxID=1907390 RepID=UPI000960B3AA|nr:alpha/beta hydrolase [Microbacterium sp. RU33B]SIT66563.1 Pimeloyl-ACP methyl ester carboxylesterase [Microbacterium sp. RU33B]